MQKDVTGYTGNTDNTDNIYTSLVVFNVKVNQKILPPLLAKLWTELFE